MDMYVDGYVSGRVFLLCLWTGMLMDMFRGEFSYLVYGQVCLGDRTLGRGPLQGKVVNPLIKCALVKKDYRVIGEEGN